MSWHADVSDWVEKPSVIQIFGDDGSECDYLPEQADRLAVLNAIDQLRRDLTGYHGQLKVHDDLQRHCERQKEQLAALQAIHKPIKDERDLYKRQADKLAAENAKLRELIRDWYELAVGGADSLTDWNHAQADLEQRMRELGIEVES